MLDECERHGHAGLELSSGFRFEENLPERVAAARGRNVDLLVHNYFPPPAKSFVLNLAATDPETRRLSLEMCRAGIELCATMGAPFYSVHSGFAMNLTPEQLGQPGQQADLPGAHLIDHETARNAFRAAVGELAEFAREKEVGLLIENNVITAQQVAAGRGGSLLMTNPTELRDFFDELSADNVGLLLDVGHAHVSAQALGFPAEEFFLQLADRVAALHLSDNDGCADSNGKFTAASWFAPYLHDFAFAPVVIEVYRLSADGRAQLFETTAALIA